MLSSMLPPKKPPRLTKAANKFDDAQLKMSSTMAGCINTNTNTNPDTNISIKDDNDINITKRNTTTAASYKPMPLTGQLSTDKAVMTKKKHLHFHSPLIKSPLKKNQQQQQETPETMVSVIQKQQHEKKQKGQELPRLLFAGMEPDKAATVNLALNTTTMNHVVSCRKLTKGTIATSNIATIMPPDFAHQQQHGHHHHDHDDNVSNNKDQKDHGAVNTAMNTKITGNKIRRKRLDRGCSSLMYACQHGDISEILDQLHNKPQVIYQRDSKNKSALHYCSAAYDSAALGNEETRTNSLVAAASIAIAAPELLESADEDGFTPLHLAVIQGNLAMVNLLLSNKADVNVVDNEGHSVVHWATVCGEIEALRAVLAAGAAVTTPDINGGSPLHYAAQMCGASYESKVSVANSTQLALEILDILLKHPQSSVDVQDKDGRQPLLWAASAGSAKAVIALVKAGARVESADKDGLTALHCAASRGHTECIDTIISLCGAPTDLIDANGCTALHYAVTLGHADATARLLDLDADPNRQDRKGRTPAHCGCAKGQFETVRLLKERGANLWLRNAKGDLPVHEAACSGRRELVEWLLDQRPKQVNTTSNDGRSLLHISATNDYTDMCKILLDHGSDINALYRNSKGVVMTPLDCALQKGYRSTAKFLQSQGGLPAGKLRFAPRPANPFDNIPADFVRPLRYSEREEVQDMSESKKYVVQRKTSDGGDSDGNCSCTERTYKREQRIAHTCRRHERMRRKTLRRRTSSCGDPKEICRHEEGGDICRSKSNIEIHRRRSREQHVASSSSETCDEDVDSCENCCYHKHQKHKVLHKKRLHSRCHSKDNKDAEHVKPEKQVQENVALKSNLKPIDNELQKEVIKKEEAASIQEVSASDKGTPKISETNRPVVDLTDDEEHVTETLTTTVDVHREADETKSQVPEGGVEENVENVVASEAPDKEVDIEEKIDNSVDRVLDMVAEEILEQQRNDDKHIETKIEIEESHKKDVIDTEKKQHEHIKIEETPATPIDNSPSATRRTSEQEEHVSITKPATPTTETSATPEPARSSPSVETVEKKVADGVEKEKEIALEKSSSVDENQQNPQRDQETRRSFTLLPSDSAEEEEQLEVERKSSFQVLKSDESAGEVEHRRRKELEEHEMSDNQVFKIMPEVRGFKPANLDLSSADGETRHVEVDHEESELEAGHRLKPLYVRHSLPEPLTATGSMTVYYDNLGGRKRRFKRRVKSAGKTRSSWKNSQETEKVHGKLPNKDQQDSGFEPSPRAGKSKIPTPRNIYTAYAQRRPIYTTLEGRAFGSRVEGRKPGDKYACDMSAVTRSIQRNIRRYYMERKIFQHLLDLKSLQIRSNKLNEAVLVKRAVDDYHKSCAVLGGETGTRLRRYTYSDYTFKNFELFLYETLKSLQKPGTYNFQNINEVYEEAERRLSPDYNAYEKALQCTTKTHRCLHAAHAYTGIPCAAYIPMMNHHTMPKFGFGSYKKTGVGSFYLPKILTKTSGSCDGGSGCAAGGKVALELSSGKSKQLISLPAEKFDSNKRYYVTFTVKESGNIPPTRNCHSAAVPQTHDAMSPISLARDSKTSTK